jgi:hypothetical protein
MNWPRRPDTETIRLGDRYSPSDFQLCIFLYLDYLKSQFSAYIETVPLDQDFYWFDNIYFR